MHYDLIVIGSGAGGSTAAFDAAKAGWKVGLIDKQPPGGSCPQRACHPKKIMHHNVLPVFLSRLKKHNGLVSEPKVDWEQLVSYTQGFTKPVSGTMKKRYSDAGIDFFSAGASFVSADTIKAGDVNLRSKKFLIASGSRPRTADIDGIEHIMISDYFFTMKKLPKKIIFLGGGYVSFELATIAGLAGSEVTIINNHEQVLRQFDPGLVNIMLKSLVKHTRINIVAPAKVKGIKKGNEFIVITDRGKFSANAVFHGMGRVPDIGSLNLENAGVRHSDKGIKVNEYLQTTSSSIYAAGDCAEPGPMLTPVGGRQGEIASGNILHGNKHKYKGASFASSVFTLPILASVGTNEGREVGSLEPIYSDIMKGLEFGGWKLFLNNGKLKGAQVASLGADDIINTLAGYIGKKPENFLKHILAYPVKFIFQNSFNKFSIFCRFSLV